jgi:fructokinase
MKSTFKVAGLGEVLWDCFPDHQRLGGAPINFARHVQQLGLQSHAVTCVGRDELGEQAVDELAKGGLATDLVFQHATLPTGNVQVVLDASAKPSYAITENVAWDEIPCPQSLLDVAASLDAVSFGTLALRSEVSRETISQTIAAMPSESLKILDVNLRAPFYSKPVVDHALELANVLKLSDEELVVLATYYDLTGEVEDQLRALQQRFKLRLIAYTMGADGSILMTSDELNRADAVKVLPVDSVGAGDSFTAALCVSFLSDRPLTVCNELANEVAAYVCSQHGAVPHLPDDLKQKF